MAGPRFRQNPTLPGHLHLVAWELLFMQIVFTRAVQVNYMAQGKFSTDQRRSLTIDLCGTS